MRGFGAELLAVLRPVPGFEMEEAAEEVHPTVAGPDALPEVGSFVAVGVFGITGGGAVAEVEGKEDGFVAGEARGHVDFVGIDGEMDEGAFLEGEDLFAVVAVGFVLMSGVLDGLPGELVFELGGSNGDAVDAEHEVQRLVVFGAVVKLAGEREAVEGIN